MSKSKGSNPLGKSLYRDRFGNKKKSGKSSALHTTDLDDGMDWNKINFRSVTEENTLDEFLSTAELASTQFNAERLNATVVTLDNLCPSKDELDRNVQIQMEHKSSLRIPRRPQWDETTTPQELDETERQSFLEWRHSLATLSETEGIIITPYEKTLEFWRQLWRVIERSDIVVQIVDARNPLLFRCEDLEIYVKEVDSKKINVILINKADFLTEAQRKYWLEYFENHDLTIFFWSALKELETPKKSDGDEKEETSDDEEEETSDDDDDDEEETSDDDLGNESLLLTKQQLLECFRNLGRRLKGNNELVTVGLIGYPNVGKSSTLNALLAEKVVPENVTKMKHYQASVSATPGKTKHFQTFFIDEWLLLCDCPGLVMPNFVSSKAEMITNGILPIDQMHDYLPPTSLVCSKIPKRLLELNYGIILPPMDDEMPNDVPTPHQLLMAYARVRGFMTHKGVPDCSRAARIILKDYVNGKLCYCDAPPTVSEEEYGSRPPVPENIESFLPPEAIEAKKMAKISEDVAVFLHENEMKKNKKTAKEMAAQALLSKKHFNKNKREKIRRIYNNDY